MEVNLITNNQNLIMDIRIRIIIITRIIISNSKNLVSMDRKIMVLIIRITIRIISMIIIKAPGVVIGLVLLVINLFLIKMIYSNINKMIINGKEWDKIENRWVILLLWIMDNNITIGSNLIITIKIIIDYRTSVTKRINSHYNMVKAVTKIIFLEKKITVRKHMRTKSMVIITFMMSWIRNIIGNTVSKNNQIRFQMSLNNLLKIKLKHIHWCVNN